MRGREKRYIGRVEWRRDGEQKKVRERDMKNRRRIARMRGGNRRRLERSTEER